MTATARRCVRHVRSRALLGYLRPGSSCAPHRVGDVSARRRRPTAVSIPDSLPYDQLGRSVWVQLARRADTYALVSCASSSRSQVTVRAASAAAHLTWERPSVGHPLPGAKSSATSLTRAYSSQYFSSYPASSRSHVPSLRPRWRTQPDHPGRVKERYPLMEQNDT
jgi:hypothetical protein